MSPRKALIIGINDYDNVTSLNGCVNDANQTSLILSRNEDSSVNYVCQLFTTADGPKITKKFLREKLNALFDNFDGDILFYFSGHGTLTASGGYIVTQDGENNDPGLSMDELVILSNRSKAKSILLLLDCCFSGDIGNNPTIIDLKISELREGVTILSASRSTEVAREIGGHGIFTELVLEALNGGAADIRGRVSAASIYAYVEQVLGPWDQRPLYKSHANSLPPVRCCKPKVDDNLLRELTKFFPNIDSYYKMNPSYEHTESTSIAENIKIFNKFKILRNASLLNTEDNEDLYYIALHSKGVRLTLLGQFYWRLVKSGRI
jgi:hypothetical protein